MTTWLRGSPQPRPRGVFHPRSAVIAGGAAERPGENNGAARPGPLPGTMAQRSLSSSPPESPRGRAGRGARGCATKALPLPEGPPLPAGTERPRQPRGSDIPRGSVRCCLEGTGGARPSPPAASLCPSARCGALSAGGSPAGAARGQAEARGPGVQLPGGVAGPDPHPRPVLRGESGPDSRAPPALRPPRAPQPLRDRSRGSQRSDLGPSPPRRRAEAAPPPREAELRRHRGQRWDRTPPRSPPPLRGAVPDPRRERPPPVHREPGGGGPPGHLRLSVPPSLREQVRPRRGRWRGRCGARPVPAPGRLHPGRCGIKLGAPPRRFRVRLRSDRSARGSASGAPLRPRPPGTFRAFFLLFFRRFFPRCRRRQPSSDRNGIRGAALRAR